MKWGEREALAARGIVWPPEECFVWKKKGWWNRAMGEGKPDTSGRDFLLRNR